uniref:Manganese-dependent ADP-ribose/CDP-alcohol diphosphatase n=1 Tax=Tetraselmis sp. GSL018 TaxID=582737 RepID=A0A061R5V4_9CHLO|mmetsp:Transcript_13311/g.31512  ORF Transcript_13311/g.31512 Transcript_13311/m.31512 type:complete len:348 (-) Transcript_13311:316-1359(-)
MSFAVEAPRPDNFQCRFGMCTDVQYADVPDGVSFVGRVRYYRDALRCLRRAVLGWNSNSAQFGFHLGDIIDGFAGDQSVEALETVMQEFASFNQKTYHILGNHCLYNLTRPHLNKRLGIPEAPGGGSYYSFSPHAGWRFVVLDSYDISLLGWEPSHPHTRLASRLLDERNPNEDKNSPSGLSGTDMRFVRFNGGVGEAQLRWLSLQCEEAARQRERVVVFSHVPLHPSSAPGVTLLWNFQEVLDVIAASPCVAATFAGHLHEERYHRDGCGVHHLVLKGIVETEPETPCHAIVDLCADAIHVHGFGMQSRVLPLVPLGGPFAAATHAEASFGAMAVEVMRKFPAMDV